MFEAFEYMLSFIAVGRVIDRANLSHGGVTVSVWMMIVKVVPSALSF